jgi:F-box/TPR repeat protein Pof3
VPPIHAPRHAEISHARKQALSLATAATLQLSILDNRAAAQEKLGNDHLLSALKDARKMMVLQKTSVKGYLRAGKILQLMGQLDVALETYKYGLKQLSKEDTDGKRVRIQHIRIYQQ